MTGGLHVENKPCQPPELLSLFFKPPFFMDLTLQVEDPALRPSCRQLATHLERIRDLAR